MSRYSEAEWHPMAGSSEFTGGPKKLVLHTTEGKSIAGAEATYGVNGIAPHFTIDSTLKRFVQHIDTSRAASAMKNVSGGVQTNRDGAIQVEMIGYAAFTHGWEDDNLVWIGDIVRLICEREGIDVYNYPQFVGTESGTIATPTAPQRMSYAEWESFNGVCGHQHVPENSHWDPGRLPYQRMLELTGPIDNPTEEEDEDMLQMVFNPNIAGQVWLVDGLDMELVPTTADMQRYQSNGIQGPIEIAVGHWNLLYQRYLTTHLSPDTLAAAVVEALPPSSVGGLTKTDISEAIRESGLLGLLPNQ